MLNLFWKAIYNDGTELSEEIPNSTKTNRYEDIDRSKLTHFALFHTGDDVPLLILSLKPNQRLVWRRRTYLNQAKGIVGIVYIVGWTMKVGNQSVKSICYVYDNGRIELNDDKSDIEFLPYEVEN